MKEKRFKKIFKRIYKKIPDCKKCLWTGHVHEFSNEIQEYDSCRIQDNKNIKNIKHNNICMKYFRRIK